MGNNTKQKSKENSASKEKITFKSIKPVWKILGIIAIVILIIISAVCINSAKNTKAMNNTIDIVLDSISNCGNLVEKPNEYETIKIFGVMKFKVKQYELQNIGNVSVMTVNMFGLMQMGTVVVTPYTKDIPLLSTDFMYILGNRKYIMEIDNTMVDAGSAYKSKCNAGNAIVSKYDDLEYFSAEPSWLDEVQDVLVRKQGKDTKRLDEIVTEMTAFYSSWLNETPLLNAAGKSAKKEAVKGYAEKLITLGGLSTDVFKSALGEDVTRDFFEKVFFGTK